MTAPARLAAIENLLDALVSELGAMQRDMVEQRNLAEWLATEGEALFLEHDFAKLRDRVGIMLKKSRESLLVETAGGSARTPAREPGEAGRAA